MRAWSPAAGYGLFLCAVLAALATGTIVLADNARAHYDLRGGDKRIPSAAEPPQTGPQQENRSSTNAGGPGREQTSRAQSAKPEPASSKPPCERNVRIAASKGLRLPKGWELHCVGPGLDWEGGTHWGVTCRYDACPEGQGPYISISNPTYYVIAHELCHANFGDDEGMADSCAAKHGASLAASPYN